MNNNAFLKLSDLRIDLDGRPLFEGVSLHLKEGEKTTLSGPSGSGKSTLLRSIIGFIPFKGTISINGDDLDVHTVWKLRRAIAFVDQEPDLGGGPVKDVLLRPFSYRANQHQPYEQQEVDSLFERFLLPDSLKGKEMSSLSGGEKQRVALISALLLHRPLLLLDEAASALDKEIKTIVREYLCSQTDLTILSVSHDVRDFSLSGAVLDMQTLVKGSTS
jgi:putative ABC transport system ATP-binding protein